jgi:hypothetical protein
MGEIQDLPEDQCGRGRPSETDFVNLSFIVEFKSASNDMVKNVS